MNIADAREKLLADMERELRSPTNPENRELLYRRRTALARSHQSEVPREPTQAMLDAAYEAGLRGADDSDEEGSESSARAIWKAMFDAALASPVEGDTQTEDLGRSNPLPSDASTAKPEALPRSE